MGEAVSDIAASDVCLGVGGAPPVPVLCVAGRPVAGRPGAARGNHDVSFLVPVWGDPAPMAGTGDASTWTCPADGPRT
eukprot:11163379-Lingulodinium_polyedra.AAC.1